MWAIGFCRDCGEPVQWAIQVPSSRRRWWWVAVAVGVVVLLAGAISFAVVAVDGDVARPSVTDGNTRGETASSSAAEAFHADQISATVISEYQGNLGGLSHDGSTGFVVPHNGSTSCVRLMFTDDEICGDFLVVGGIVETRWSPDGRYAIWSNKFDSDVIMLDTEARTVTNLTDEGYRDTSAEGRGKITGDVAPNWLPDGNRIVFHRSDQTSDWQGLMTLYMDGSTGEPIDSPLIEHRSDLLGLRTYSAWRYAWIPPVPTSNHTVLVGAQGEITRSISTAEK